jgi:hypothetical protein
MIIKIDGTMIKSPTALKHGKFRLSKSGRLASGLMTMDIIAIKRRIDLSWEVISGKQMSNILDLLDANTFYTIEFPDPKDPFKQSTMTAYVGDVNLEYLRSDFDRVWKNITLPFIER